MTYLTNKVQFSKQLFEIEVFIFYLDLNSDIQVHYFEVTELRHYKVQNCERHKTFLDPTFLDHQILHYSMQGTVFGFICLDNYFTYSELICLEISQFLL